MGERPLISKKRDGWKTAVFTLSLTLSLTLFGGLVWLYYHYYPALHASKLHGFAALGLILLGMFQLLTPLDIRSRWESVEAGEIARDYGLKMGGGVGLITAVLLIFYLINWLLELPNQLDKPALLLPMLILGAPLVAIVVDLIQHNVRRTLRNLIVGYTIYAFKIYFLLIAQFIYVPIAFALFPAGFFLQLISIAEAAIRWFQAESGLPILCQWSNIEPPYCLPALFTFHIGHLILAYLGAKHGDQILDRWGGWLQTVIEAMDSWMEK